LDRFLHHAASIAITGRSYRLRHQAPEAPTTEPDPKPANAPTGSAAKKKPKPNAEMPADQADAP